MFYVIPAGIAFGSVMYYLGSFERITQQGFNLNSTVQKTPDENATSIMPTTNTFSVDAITSITRTIEINPRCRIIYSTLHKSPLSVHQFLDLSVIQGEAQRAKQFHVDANISPSKFATTNDHYLKAGAFRNLSMTRGHMAAAGNYSSNQQLKNSTFSFANTVPQHSHNNGGIWNTFQRYSRSLLKEQKCDTVQIISGPIYTPNKKLAGYDEIYVGQQVTLLKNGVVVPPRLYKIIKCNKMEKSYASGFTFLNEKTYDNTKRLVQFQCPIQEIEDETGLTFNFKEKLDGKLVQFDQAGMNRPKLKYDLQFYSKLFEDSSSIDEMNGVLRRAQEQKIYLDQKKEQNQSKIQIRGLSEIQGIQSSQKSTSCQKLNQYLKLHRNLFYLGGDKGRFPDLEVKLEEGVRKEIPSCRKNATPQDLKLIKMRISGKDKRYRSPAKDELEEHFINQKQEISTNKVDLIQSSPS